MKDCVGEFFNADTFTKEAFYSRLDNGHFQNHIRVWSF